MRVSTGLGEHQQIVKGAVLNFLFFLWTKNCIFNPVLGQNNLFHMFSQHNICDTQQVLSKNRLRKPIFEKLPMQDFWSNAVYTAAVGGGCGKSSQASMQTSELNGISAQLHLSSVARSRLILSVSRLSVI